MSGQVAILAECGDCEKILTLNVSAEGFQKWKDGELIQRALPELSADERELLISNTCGNCFDAMFADDEGEE